MPDIIPPDVVPAGPISIAVDGLRTLLANVPFFQAWTVTANATAALTRIWVGEVSYPIFSATIASNVLTIQTREPHLINAGDIITIEGAGIGAESVVDLSGQYAAIDVDATTFTAATTLADIETVYPDDGLVVPGRRPLAVIGLGEVPLETESIGTGGATVSRGSLEILFEADVSPAYVGDPRNAPVEMWNAYGQLLYGLQTTQETGDFMFLSKCEPWIGPEFTCRPEQDDNTNRFERWRAVIRVQWGLNA